MMTSFSRPGSFSNKPEPIGSIKLLTFNIRVLKPFEPLFREHYKDERLEEFVTYEMPKFDIICLQDLVRTASHRQQKFLNAASERRFVHQVGPPETKWYQKDQGLIILSKHPVVDHDGIVFEAQTGYGGVRGVVYALIQITDPTSGSQCMIHVFNTQLSQTDESCRSQQLVELMRFVSLKQQAQNNAYPVFIVGDFNLDGRQTPEAPHLDSKEYTEMVNMFTPEYTDLLKQFNNGQHPVTHGDVIWAHQKCRPKERILTPREHFRLQRRLDYIFYKSSVPRSSYDLTIANCQVVPFYVQGREFTQLSDHYGILVEFTLPALLGMPRPGQR
eukprot:gnl/Hemi2/22104_TR7363_c0_g1_i1.p1 gnl/Hemi2/22104_TR7363_c0_g1~~gnl/Hemi2/22104_TR7363_c0_g1_i1.p1  ORF type:complete len:330 (-),score=62.67 gnl/Hemi2/22104_TR7363_c0_g1_i1:159-1148(-)